MNGAKGSGQSILYTFCFVSTHQPAPSPTDGREAASLARRCAWQGRSGEACKWDGKPFLPLSDVPRDAHEAHTAGPGQAHPHLKQVRPRGSEGPEQKPDKSASSTGKMSDLAHT